MELFDYLSEVKEILSKSGSSTLKISARAKYKFLNSKGHKHIYVECLSLMLVFGLRAVVYLLKPVAST